MTRFCRISSFAAGLLLLLLTPCSCNRELEEGFYELFAYNNQTALDVRIDVYQDLFIPEIRTLEIPSGESLSLEYFIDNDAFSTMYFTKFILTFSDGTTLEYEHEEDWSISYYIDHLAQVDSMNPLWPTAIGSGYSQIDVDGYKLAYEFVITDQLLNAVISN